MRVVACVLLQRSFPSRTCLKFYRSQLSAGQERQEGLSSQVSSLEQAQAALQAEAAARPSDSFLGVPPTGQVGLVKPVAVMPDHATMGLHTHLQCGWYSERQQCQYVLAMWQSRLLPSRATLMRSTGTLQSSASGMGKKPLYGFSVAAEVFLMLLMRVADWV